LGVDGYLPRVSSAIRKAKIRLLEAYDNVELTAKDFEEIRQDIEALSKKVEAALSRYNGAE